MDNELSVVYAVRLAKVRCYVIRVAAFGATALILLAALSACGTASSATPAFPPKSESDLKGLAAASRVSLRFISRDMESFPNCACRVSVLVPRGLSPKKTAEALLKVFYDENLDKEVGDGPGGAVVFGYFKMSQYGHLYTAGRVDLDASHGHTMTLDVGSALSPREWAVKY